MRKVPMSILLALILVPAAAVAEPIFPAASYDAMHTSVQRQDRAFYRFLALPFGWALEANLKTVDDAKAISTFLDQSESEDVEAVTGRHPYDMFTNYEEHGDLGMFGGVAAAGTAFKYMTMKRDGASPEALAAARIDVVRAIENQHVFWAVTGTPGAVARGIQRLVDENPESPDIPDYPRTLVPFTDVDGNPLPAPKDNGTWREDNSKGELPANTWIWIDSCSKDQLVGQIFAMVLLYDAAVGDPDIDQSIVEQMRADALATAQMLMVKREISEMEGPAGVGEYDLIIMDTDGRPTMFHDLNPYSMEKVYVPEDGGSYNIFNLTLALGIMKGLFHVTGDEAVETYIYEELMGNRGYLEMMDRSVDEWAVLDYIYADRKTNFSNVNMAATGIWLALYTESDDAVAGPLENFLEQRWWNREGVTRTAKVAKQPFFNLVWMGITDRGVDRALADETAALLGGFPLGPYLNPLVENCDAAEIEALQCLAIDNETIIELENGVNRGGRNVSGIALDPSIRPPSNFDARSDPFEVNGGGGLRLNPGGDLLAAYWMGRYLPLNPAGVRGVSPNVRAHMPVPGLDPIPDTAEAATDVIETDTIVGQDTVEPDVLEPDTAADAGVDVAVGTDNGNTTDTTTGVDEGGHGGGSGCTAGGIPGAAAPLLLMLMGGFAAIRARRRI